MSDVEDKQGLGPRQEAARGLVQRRLDVSQRQQPIQWVVETASKWLTEAESYELLDWMVQHGEAEYRLENQGNELYFRLAKAKGE